MATVYSNQQTIKRALEANTGYSLAEGLTADNGRMHVTFVTWTVAAINVADVIQLFVLPKNSRLIRGYIGGPALTAATTLSVGTDVALVDADGATALTAAGAANLLAATASSSIFLVQFAATRLLGAGGFTTAPTTVSATLAGANNAVATGIVYAWAEYLYN